MRILLDTCILLDAILNRQPFDIDAQALILVCSEQKVHGFITANSVTDIYYLAYKVLRDETKTREILKNAFYFLDILSITKLECNLALSSDVKDFEDAIQVESAKSNFIDIIVTRNLKDYRNSPIPVLSPADCLKKLGVKSWG